MKINAIWKALAVALVVMAGTTNTQAQSVEEFYSQNDITMVVGTAAGGSTDFFARTMAPYLSKYIPGNPDIIVQNKPGAGGLITAAELQTTMPSDGSYIATLQRNNFTDPLLSDERVDFDAREVKHIGSVGKEIYVIFQHPDDPGTTTVEEALNHEMILAATGSGSANYTYPLLVNELLGGKLKLVPGYSGNEEQALAIERGEADGRAGTYSMTQRGQLKQWQEDGKLHYVLQFALEDHPDLAGVPNVFDAIKDDETRRIFRFMLIPQGLGRIFSAPGDIPEDRLAALREAFVQAAEDPAFIAEMERSGAEAEYTTGEELQEMAEELMGTPPAIVDRIKTLISGS